MLLLFLFGFLLGLFLGSHKHLLLGFRGWAFPRRELINVTQAKTNFLLKTLPYFVGATNIKAQ